MSGKFSKKNSRRPLIPAVLTVTLALAVAGLLLMKSDGKPGLVKAPWETDETTTEVNQQQISQTQENQAPQIVSLGKDLYITNIGSYTGIYMEDGSNELLSDILMLVVKNEGNQAIQYAEITLPTDSGEAQFVLTTLPAGESVVLLEKKRMEYSGEEDMTLAVADNVAVFAEPLDLHQDKLKLQILDGAANVTNISAEDITGEVVIYYKNAAEDLLYGGITYRIRVENGIKAGEIRQIMGRHLSATGSRIMFVTVS